MAQVTLLKRAPNRAHVAQVVEATDEVVARSIQRASGGPAALWDDPNVTTITIGGGAAQTSTTIGKAGQTASFLGSVSVAQNVIVTGDLTVNGTTTTFNTDNLAVEDRLVILGSGASVADESGVAFERGSTGDDAILLWNEANSRFELGFFNTTGGTSVPTGALATRADLRIDDLSLSGTTVTADAALTITATGAALTLAATGAFKVEIQTNGVARWNVDSAGHTLWNADNTNDIGAAGASRPRRAYIGTEVVVGSTVTIGSTSIAASGALTTSTLGTYTESIGGNRIESQTAGGAAGSGATGFTHTVTGSAGATGTAAAVPTPSGAGGAWSWTAGAGGAGVGTATPGDLGADAGVGSSWTIKAGPGGAGSAGAEDPGHAANGGSLVVSGGDGGNGAGTSDNGSGGGLDLRGGAAGTGGSGAAGAHGTLTIGATATAGINIGTGTDQHTIIVGNTAHASTSVTLRAGGSADVIFQARGGSAVTLNQSGDTALTGFPGAVTSIIGALNFLVSTGGASTQVENSYTNVSGGTLNEGAVVAPVEGTTKGVTKASAATDNAAARVIGFVEPAAGIADTASGQVVTEGVATVRFAAGEGVGNHAGKEVFLSTTAGLCTLTAPSGSGQVVQLVGIVYDSTAYNNGLESTMEVQLIRGGKLVV